MFDLGIFLFQMLTVSMADQVSLNPQILQHDVSQNPDIIQPLTTIGQPSKRHLNGVSLVGR